MHIYADTICVCGSLSDLVAQGLSVEEENEEEELLTSKTFMT